MSDALPSSTPLRALRVIREPYPGLRPFLDHEQSLLKGRDAQIREIVDRLRDHHFVAIIGGSGSGKSSLIRAGVVPALRAHAIQEAGDYWAPVVFTPGTVRGSAAPGGPPAPSDETPVTRLAYKFSQVLAGTDAAHVDPIRAVEITKFLRQGAGFGRLVAAYHDLLPRQGPSTDRARFLFVIDQFEELFHPHNRDNPDARTIIDALIEHDRKPDTRCFVVMTMRSEHLSDCAAHLQLPEAINRSFYLMRRLDSREMREVIVGPAQVLALQTLRQRQALAYERDAADGEPVFGTAVPEVDFDRKVVARLLADARQIEDDTDHLPLLQHLLARLWAAARQREQLAEDQAVPGRITAEDLEAAVDPRSAQAAGWLAEDRQINTLRRSLQNWAEWQYARRDPTGQARLDHLLSRLAYKDPTNGLYFQQRLEVDDPSLLPGVPAPRDTLLALLDDGFLDTVNYLYWDDDNRAHVTLKVSHEAFIRGWQRFRDRVDCEADRFDEFVAVMQKAAQWDEAGRAQDLLLGDTELVRLEAAQLLAVLEDPAQFGDLLKVLRLYRQDRRLDRAALSLSEFLEASRERRAREQRELEATTRAVEEARAERQRADERARYRQFQLRALYVVLGLVLLPVLHADLIRDPASEMAMGYARARQDTSLRAMSNGSAEAGAARKELVTLREAAEGVMRARQGPALASWLPDGVSRHWNAVWLRDAVAGWPLVGDWLTVDQLVQAESASSESAVLDALRGLLTAAPWPDTTPNASADLAPLIQGGTCQLGEGVAQNDPQKSVPEVRGKRLFAGSSTLGLFIPDEEQGTAPAPAAPASDASPSRAPLVVYGARLEGAHCVADQVVFSTPRETSPALLVESRGQVLGLIQRPGLGTERQTLQLFNLIRSPDPQSGRSKVRLAERRQIQAPELQRWYDWLTAQPPTTEVFELPTQATTMGVQVRLPGSVTDPAYRWTLLSSDGQPLQAGLEPTTTGRWQALQAVTGAAASPSASASGPAAARCDRQRRSVSDLLAKAGYEAGDKTTTAWTSETPGLCVVFALLVQKPPAVATLADRPQVRAQTPAELVYPLNVSIYPEATLRAAYGRNNEVKDPPRFIPAPMTSWIYTQEKRGTARQWWIGMAGSPADGWLATTPAPVAPAASAASAATAAARAPRAGDLASPFSPQALIRLADRVLAAAPPPATATAPARPARVPSSDPAK